MRKRFESASRKISVNAIAGTSVVLFGIDLVEELIEGLRGFGILREDHSENEKGCLINLKRFRAQESKSGSDQNPIQEFVWGDYAAKENHQYTYTVTARYGSPGSLTDGESVAAEVATENAAGSKHQIYFNRRRISSSASRCKYRTNALHCSHLSSRMCRSIWSKGALPHLRLQGFGSGQVLIGEIIFLSADQG